MREHEAVWVDSDLLLKEGIMFSGRALLDHMPSSTQTVLRQLTPMRDADDGFSGGTNGDEDVRGGRGTQALVGMENTPLNASAETSAPLPYSMEA